MGKEEKRRLDNLMGMALLDERICERLLNERDTSWLTSFGLSTETQSWLQTVEAQSLTELAQAIVDRVQGDTIIISTQAA
jgi:hypothetical protein